VDRVQVARELQAQELLAEQQANQDSRIPVALTMDFLEQQAVQILVQMQPQVLEHTPAVAVVEQDKQAVIQVKLLQEIHQLIAQRDEKAATELLMQLPDTVNFMAAAEAVRVTTPLVVMLVLWRWPWAVQVVAEKVARLTSTMMHYFQADFREQEELVVDQDQTVLAQLLYN
jgi:hypothetical protein